VTRIEEYRSTLVRRKRDVRVLRKAVGYSWSVVVAASP